MKQAVGLNRYIVIFTIAYTIGLIALAALFYFFEFGQNAGASIGVLIGAAMYAGGKFIQEQKRIPTKEERSKLVWQSLGITWLVSVTLLAVTVLALDGEQDWTALTKQLDGFSLGLLAGAGAIVSLVYWWVLSFSYGGLTRRQFEGFLRRGKI